MASLLNDKLRYRGYTAEVKADTDVQSLRGQVLGIKDIITFEGDTFDAVIEDFHRAIDEYLAFCQELGQEPNRPLSGKFTP